MQSGARLAFAYIALNYHEQLATSPSAASPSATNTDHLPLPLPVLRMPMLDRERQLFAYEIMFHREASDDETLLQSMLSTITDGALTRLVRGNRAFLNMPAELLPENSDVLLHQPRLGLVLQPHVATDDALMKRLEQMAQRGCQLMLDAAELTLENNPAIEPLLRMVQWCDWMPAG